MSGPAVQDPEAALVALLAAHDAFAACDIDLLTAPKLLKVCDGLDTLGRQLPTQNHRVLARLQVETTAKALGAKSWRDVLRIRWRLSSREANRRLAEAALLGPGRSLIGEPLEPVLPATAAAQAHGLITPEHVDIIRKSIAKIPGFVDAGTAAQIEVDWARLAVKVGPKELLDGIELRLFLLDQDGPEPDDTERNRKRGISKGKQRTDGMTPISGEMTPEAWATWEAILAKYAAPGMCNPADSEPCTAGTPSQAQIDNDHRSLAQRTHDAFVVVGRIALMCGELGQLNGLPVSIIIRTTLEDLESRAGIAVTGGGTKMSVKDVLRLAGHSNLFLAVFNKATGSAMDLFRARRVASLAQRIMLIGREGGCTKPGCTVGPYGCQVHHAVADWADDGNTNVDEMTLACGPDNRMVGKGGWTTKMSDRHDVEWIPPPHLDTGQSRINYHHTPERLLTPDNDPEPQHDPEPQQDNDTSDTTPADPDTDEAASSVPEPEPAADATEECDSGPLAPSADDSIPPADGAPPEPARDDDCDPAEPFDPWAPAPAEADDPAPSDHDDDDDGDIDPVSPEAEQDCAPEPFDPWAPDTLNDPGQPAPPDPGQPAPADDYTAECRSPQPQPNEPPTPEPFDPWGPDTRVTGPDDDTVAPESAEPEQNQPTEAEPFDPWGPDAPVEPGGPAPPDHQTG